MKEWQHGYELEWLKAFEKAYEPYNKYSLSPFSKMKKNDIAAALHKNELNWKAWTDGFCAYKMVTSKVRSAITLFPGGPTIAYKEKGDVVISHMFGPQEWLAQYPLGKLQHENCWFYVWAEDLDMNRFAVHNGFKYVGGKVTTFGEIYAIYFRDAVESTLFSERTFPKVDPNELLNVKKLWDIVPSINRKEILSQLESVEFTNHYSNYNVDKSWSAISLRGYSADPSFITKPDEMSDRWKENNKDVEFKLQDTPLYDSFPRIREFLQDLQVAQGWFDIHRVRLMKLKPGGGELERHTDLVDSESGLCRGQLARFHIPIKTNNQVIFTSWDYKGNRHDVNMKEGSMWVLNTKYPHKVYNGGSTERIHLVIDIMVNDKIYDLIKGDNNE